MGMSRDIKKIKDLYYYEKPFTHKGDEIPCVHYYRLTNIQKSEDGDEVISVDVEVVFEPEKYLQGEEQYYSKSFSVLRNDFTSEIRFVLESE
ncbi:hypothetical protein D3C87_407200 [compost metagenome]